MVPVNQAMSQQRRSQRREAARLCRSTRSLPAPRDGPGPDRGARDRDAAGPGVSSAAGRQGTALWARPHAARQATSPPASTSSPPTARHWRPCRPSSDRRGSAGCTPRPCSTRFGSSHADEPGPALFVGIGPSTEVDRYLAGVNHTVITEFWEGRWRPSPAVSPDLLPQRSTSGSPPTRAVGHGPGMGSDRRILDEIVVMNADERPGSTLERTWEPLPAVLWIAVGVLAAGTVLHRRRLAPDRRSDPPPSRQPSEHCVSSKEEKSCSRSRSGIRVLDHEAGGGHGGVPCAQDAREQQRVPAAARAWL